MAPKKAAPKKDVAIAPPEPANIQQRKVSRGSRRRITKALDIFEKAVDVLAKELDLQIFAANEDGSRKEAWPIIAGIKQVPTGIRSEVMAILNNS